MMLSVSTTCIVGLHSGQCFLLLHTSVWVGVSEVELNASGKRDKCVG